MATSDHTRSHNPIGSAVNETPRLPVVTAANLFALPCLLASCVVSIHCSCSDFCFHAVTALFAATCICCSSLAALSAFAPGQLLPWPGNGIRALHKLEVALPLHHSSPLRHVLHCCNGSGLSLLPAIRCWVLCRQNGVTVAQ